MRDRAILKTHSGATYKLTDIEEVEPSDGSLEGALREALGTYKAKLARLEGDIPMTNVGPYELVTDENAHGIQFFRLPNVGDCFFYYHDAWGACRSSSIVEIWADEGL